MTRLSLVLAATLCLPAAGCRKARTTGAPEDGPKNPPGEAGLQHSDEPPPKMTNMDPKSPEAWKQAEAIATTAAAGTLEKRSDDLPFMFMADHPPAVLVHQGEVVSEKGAAAAGRYLRDLGIIDGKGPGIKDVLFVLYAFDAWPPIEEVPEQAYINVDDPSLKDLTAAIELDTDVARVVLHYFLPAPEEPSREELEENDVGAPDPDFDPPVVKPVARAVLEIPRTGEPGWKPIQKFNWAAD